MLLRLESRIVFEFVDDYHFHFKSNSALASAPLFGVCTRNAHWKCRRSQQFDFGSAAATTGRNRAIGISFTQGQNASLSGSRTDLVHFVPDATSIIHTKSSAGVFSF
jgi:hypothetical protein